VDKYDLKFTQLSRYAKHLLPIKKWRVKRFIRGLKSSMYIMMVSQVFSFYSSAIVSTRLIEAQELEDMAVGQSKRLKKKVNLLNDRDQVHVCIGDEMAVTTHGFRGGLDRDLQLVARSSFVSSGIILYVNIADDVILAQSATKGLELVSVVAR